MICQRRIILFLLMGLTAVISAGCNQPRTVSEYATKKGLLFGVAVQAGDISNPVDAALIKQNFNLIVPENTMKWSLLRPNKTFWNWSDMDALVAFAQKNKMKIKGHTFLWHQQNPGYVNNLKTREEAIALMSDQITTVMTRYKGKIFEYDIANETLNDDGTMRDSIWYTTIGPDYLDIAFRTARKADPGAKLILNDYNTENIGSAKSDAFYELVKGMVDRKVPIDGVGIQMHLMAEPPVNEQSVRDNIKRLNQLGLAVSFTEVDVRAVLPVTPGREQEQINVFTKLMEIALSEENAKTYIVWGYTDKRSWVPAFFPGYGNANLFDKDLKPKKAFYSLAKMIKEKK
jgi:endo-1,4-beta-xylanase